MKKILDYDPAAGITQYFHYDEVSGDWSVESVQDTKPIIEYNKILQNDGGYTAHGIKNEMWHYARIPTVVQEKWLREKGVDLMNKDHWGKVKQLLNDPEYRYLKTTTKKV